MSGNGNDVDIRKQVDDNRGIAKKLELLVPGLRQYRKTDDLRVADDLLRHQVADKVDQAKVNLEAYRKQMVVAGDFASLSSVGSLIFELQELSGKVRYAQQGYAPLVAAISINEDKLNALYNYDYEFVNSALSLVEATSKLQYDQAAALSNKSSLDAVSSAMVDFKRKWSVRLEAIEGVLVTG